ncbi:hypothetical protein CEUSTIGMA_g1494.t1 [Chlamydomonas eustigma]|uniref:Uncharacterized protein n=1 Tax=Chlamydomonas eustigma TaxID=1157962 RepID=A0A250WT86_9CHLO|nr:hypothetical protein CEUSTIGMA_g1494.t1 [Chlamydomonas eustigma]|eukprot:GAX74044.1 hypothetical protein CEUSTIGMA_g1494.t1 [Chlamydomonas eustigma]
MSSFQGATATQRSNNRLTKSDMEASRLVFVYVKDAKPKRKVAVPVPEGLSWAEFLQQVKAKLRLSGVKEIFLASTGQKVTGLEELQDIDELCVVEGPDIISSSNAAVSEASLRSGSLTSTSENVQQNGPSHKQYSTPDRHKVVVSTTQSSSSSADDDEGKYRAKVHPLKRAIQKLLPTLFAPSLPVTNREAEAAVSSSGSFPGRRRKGRRNPLNLRTLILLLAFLSCFATMIWYFLKSSQMSNLT